MKAKTIYIRFAICLVVPPAALLGSIRGAWTCIRMIPQYVAAECRAVFCDAKVFWNAAALNIKEPKA